MIKRILLAALLLASGTAHAQLYPKFGPVTGVLKGSVSTPQTSAAVSTDITGLWSGSCSVSNFLRGDGTCAVPAGTGVTSVGASFAGSWYTVSGSPVTSTGTLAFGLTTGLTAKSFLATPTGTTGTLSLRVIALGDLPTINVTGGGTGLGTLPAHGVLLGEGTSNVGNVAAMAADTLLQGQGVSADPVAVAVNNCGSSSTALSYSTSTHTFGCQTISVSSGTVTSVAAGTGITASPSPIVSTGTISVDQSFSPTWTGIHTWNAISPIVLSASSTSVNSITVTNTNTGTGALAGITLNGGAGGSVQATSSGFTGPGGANALRLINSGANPISFVTNSTARMTIDGTGLVSIIAPTSGVALTVSGSTTANAANFVGTTIQGGIGITDGQAGTRNWTIHSGYCNGSSPGVFDIYDSTSAASRLCISTTGQVTMPNLPQTSAAQTGTVCWSSPGGGGLTVDTTVACLASTIRVKQAIENLDIGLAEVMNLHPVSYDLKPEFNPAHLGRQVGLIAEEVQEIDPRLIALDDDGSPRGVRYMQLTAVLARAIQQQQHEIQALALAVFLLASWNIYLTVRGRRN